MLSYVDINDLIIIIRLLLQRWCLRKFFQHLWLSWRRFFWQCRCFRWILHQLRNHQLWLLILHLRRKLFLRRFWSLRLIIRFLRFFFKLLGRTRLFWLLCQQRLVSKWRMIRSILPKLRLLWLWLRLKQSISYPYKFIIRHTQLLCQWILDRCLIAILLRPRRLRLRCVLNQQLRRLSGLLIFRWHLILFVLRLFRQFRKSFL